MNSTKDNKCNVDYLKEYLERCQKVTDEHKKHLSKCDLSLAIPLQLLKMFEEVGEVQKALLNGDVKHAIKECNDVILTAIVMQEELDCSPDNIIMNMELELQKCERRVKKLYKIGKR